ncbi:MAG: hypothetical protein PHH41_01030 [Sulfurimonas sp.]|nr:hypothetical protein [Sulfurimonas sp.]MDD5201704.1 hypothetical protein [Sulfurimonas sp.]
MKIVLSIALALFLLGCSEDKAATAVENNDSVVVEQSAPAVETPAVETPAAVVETPAVETPAVVEEATNAATDATNTAVETTDAATQVVEDAAADKND